MIEPSPLQMDLKLPEVPSADIDKSSPLDQAAKSPKRVSPADDAGFASAHAHRQTSAANDPPATSPRHQMFASPFDKPPNDIEAVFKSSLDKPSEDEQGPRASIGSKRSYEEAVLADASRSFMGGSPDNAQQPAARTKALPAPSAFANSTIQASLDQAEHEDDDPELAAAAAAAGPTAPLTEADIRTACSLQGWLMDGPSLRQVLETQASLAGWMAPLSQAAGSPFGSPSRGGRSSSWPGLAPSHSLSPGRTQQQQQQQQQAQTQQQQQETQQQQQQQQHASGSLELKPFGSQKCSPRVTSRAAPPLPYQPSLELDPVQQQHRQQERQQQQAAAPAEPAATSSPQAIPMLPAVSPQAFPDDGHFPGAPAARLFPPPRPRSPASPRGSHHRVISSGHSPASPGAPHLSPRPPSSDPAGRSPHRRLHHQQQQQPAGRAWLVTSAPGGDGRSSQPPSQPPSPRHRLSSSSSPAEPSSSQAAADHHHDRYLEARQALQQALALQQYQAALGKVRQWEPRLQGLLGGAAPQAIKDFVQHFRADIVNEMDKRLFKQLCDRWCVVLEHPEGSGTKCLALKSDVLQGLSGVEGQ